MEKLFENRIEVFKTNIQDQGQAQFVYVGLLKLFPDAIISVDIEDCDKVLRIEGLDIDADKVINLIKANGFDCRMLE